MKYIELHTLMSTLRKNQNTEVVEAFLSPAEYSEYITSASERRNVHMSNFTNVKQTNESTYFMTTNGRIEYDAAKATCPPGISACDVE